MRRFTMPAALVFAGALALTGCTAQDGDNAGAAGAAAETVCETVASGIRDISNGIQNTLATATAENRDEVEAYLTEAGDRVEALAADAEDSEFAAAVEEFAAEVEASGEYAGDLPDDPSTQDPEELSERQAALQETAANVQESCSADEE